MQRARAAIFENLADLLTNAHSSGELSDLFLSLLLEKRKRVERGILFVYDESNERLTVFAARGYNIAQLVPLHLKTGEGMAGRAWHARRGAIYSDPNAIQAAWADLPPAHRERLFAAQSNLAPSLSAIAVPLLTADSVLGVVILESVSETDGFDADDLVWLQRLATIVSLGLENTRLRERVNPSRGDQAPERLKSEAVSFLAHEMRTPLTSIKGYATTLLLEEATFSEEKQREFIKRIDEECDTLVNLIHDLLESSIMDAGLMALEREPVMLPRLVEEIVHDFIEHNPKHRFLIDFPESFPLVQADPDRLAQVLSNLLENAVKYSPRGGLIIVQGELRPHEAVVSVADQGIGIAPEHLNRLFEKFFRVKDGPSRGTVGSGLGLPIARTIVESHGGRIWAESRLGEGSIFYFALPLQETVEVAACA